MGESETKCVGCDRPLAMYVGLTINGDAYHFTCWNARGRPIPKAHHVTSADEARPS